MVEGTFLERIVAATRARLTERQAHVSYDALREQAAQRPPALDFAAALRPADGGVRAIAEIKRASPSKGELRPDLDPAAIAALYMNHGTAAISVLTEQDFFQGSLDDLRAVKRATEGRVPVLRKDFITDPYQVVEARAAGADSYLLIVALLDDAALRHLIAVGRELGMEPLVEVHDAVEARRAVRSGARIIGVNARDLRTFQVDTTLLKDIRPLLPADRIVVAESGIATMSDVVRMRGYGAQAILVGETLMRAVHPDIVLRHLIDLPLLVRQIPPRPGPIVKLCGMQTPADALAAYEAGADMLGFVFVPGKRRRVSVEQARQIARALPDDAKTVGLFVHEVADRIAEIVEQVGLKAVQIVGEANQPATFAKFPVPVMLAVRANIPFHWLPFATVALIDSAPPGVWGGSGQVGNWDKAKVLAQTIPTILAGGLTPANVGDAIQQVQPWGVDVSSGIEDASGQKDPARMRAFVQAVRDATRTGHG